MNRIHNLLVAMELLVFVLAVLLWYFIIKKRNEPKITSFLGPPSLPILGHLTFLGKHPARKFLQWKNKYGPVIQIFLANQRVVILNDKTSIVECFAKTETSGRLSFKLIDWHVARGGIGFMFNQGVHADEQRNFFLAAFRKYGVTKNKMEDRFRSEVDELLKIWRSKSGQYFDLSGSCSMFVLNSMWQVIGSKRYDYKQACSVLHDVGMVQEADTWLSKLIYVAPHLVAKFSNIVEERLQAGDHLVNSQHDLIEERKLTRVPQAPRDVIDMLLDKVEATQDIGSIYHESHDVLPSALRDLLMATIEAMSITLEWFILYGIQYPWMVEKIQEDIQTTVGRGRQPTLADRDQMPFIQACILEILRITSVAPLGIPHSALQDTTFRGCDIPKGTIILSNLWAVHHDPAIWDNPEEFRPQRFLNESGQVCKEIKNKTLPFSSGKRACIGQSIVEDEIFLLLSSLYQEFSIKSKEPIKSMEGVYGLTYRPPYGVKISATPR